MNDSVSGEPLRVLLIEDSQDDAALVARALRKAGFAPRMERVDTAQAMREALRARPWDLILSDYVVPGFGGLEALAIAAGSGLDLPFILVSGKIGEESAVEALKRGASDLVMKDRLARLGPVVRRELADAAARRAARRAQVEWRMLLASVHATLLVHDPELHVVRANLAYARLVNLPVKELPGRLAWQTFPGATEPAAECLAVVRGGQESAEWTSRLPGGAVIESRLFRIGAERGPESLFVHVLQDVTERDRVREAIEQRENRFRALLEHAADLVAVVDGAGRISYISPSIERMGGYAPSEALGRPYLEFAHPDDHASAMAGFAAVLADPGRPHSSELRFRRRDGAWVWLESVARNAVADPLIAGIVINARDVTERKRMEEAVRASRDLLHSVLEHVPIRVFWKDGSLRYLGCNSLFAKDAGMASPEDLLGKDDFQLAWREQAAEYQADDRRVMQDGAPRIGYEEPQTTSDGSSIWLRTSKVPLRDAAGATIGVLGVYDDITERKTAERALARAVRALRTLSAGNEALVRAPEEAALLDEMCRVIVEVGGYRIAAVGYTEGEAGEGVRILACRGADLAELRETLIPWAGEGLGQSAARADIHPARPEIARNVMGDPRFAPWHRLPREQGITDALALPLRPDAAKPPLGALLIASAEADTFNEEEVKLLGELAGDLAFGIGGLRMRAERRDAALKLRLGLERTVETIAATVERRDPYTAGHERRVAALAVAIAREMGLPDTQCDGIHFGGLIHDLGKIQVPAELLAKPGALSAIEYELIKVHPQAGYEILGGIEFPWPVAQMVWQHHERLDGSGYPQKLTGERIILEARILAVADVVEAMASHRPYRAALGIDAALAQIEKDAGTKLDAVAVAACVRLFRDKGYQFPA